MNTAATQKVLTDFLLPIASLAIVIFGSYLVWRRRWFRVRPVLSTYVWFLAITGAAMLLTSYSLVVCSGKLQYALCRVYLVGYYSIIILTSLFTVAVVYEFLFCLTGPGTNTRRIAVAAFFITTTLIISATYFLTSVSSHAHSTMDDVSRHVFGITALALVFSGIFILVVKNARPLALEPGLSLAFTGLVMYNFVDLLGSFVLRGRESTWRTIVSVLWIGLVILLCRALKNGPPIPASSAKSAGP